MHPLELRLGNYVADAIYKKPMYIVFISAKDVYLDFEGNEGDVWESLTKDVIPLPIKDNTNILIEFGFSYDKENDIYVRCKDNICIKLKQGSDGKYDVFNSNAHDRVEFIHQLQNFVFDSLDVVLLPYEL